MPLEIVSWTSGCQLDLGPTEVTQQFRRVPATAGRIPVAPGAGERGVWPLLAGSAEDRVLGSDSFRADFPSQTPDLQDPDFPPGSQIKVGLHGVSLLALLKDQAGRSVLTPAVMTVPAPPSGEGLPADSPTSGWVQWSREVSGTRHLPPGSLSDGRPLVMSMPRAVNSSYIERPI